jgi:hypothetical protein
VYVPRTLTAKFSDTFLSVPSLVETTASLNPSQHHHVCKKRKNEVYFQVA